MQVGLDEEFHPLGVTIAEAPPIGIQNVELLPGLNVLYGKNGSGKTKILEAVKRLLIGASWAEVPESGPDPVFSLYSSGGIHVRRFPNPRQSPPYSGDAPLETYYVADDFWAPADSPRVPDEPGFAWWKYGWDAWISAFLLSEPWETAPLEDLRNESFRRARELGLSKSEWLWLLEQERYLIKPSDGRIFLCDPNPFEGPLRHHWEKSQAKWLEAFSSDSGLLPVEQRLKWSSYEKRWGHPVTMGETGLLSPLPEILGLANFPEWVGYPVLEIDIEALWIPKIDSLFEVEDFRAEFKWSPLVDTLIDHLAHHEREIEQRSRRRFPTKTMIKQFDNLSEVCRDLEQRVNSRLEKLFLNPPRIRISDGRTGYLSSESPLNVHVQVDLAGPWFPISGLGDAHQRYLMKAISIELLSDRSFSGKYRVAKQVFEKNDLLHRWSLENALPLDRQIEIKSPGFAFVDEPERGLHPQAEAFLAEGLANLADYVFTTTHSLKVLNVGLKRGCASLVERDLDGNFQLASKVPNISTKFVSQLEKRLGVEPADLVSLISAFVLVEGAHDRVVLEHFLAEFMERHRIEIIPMQGTKGVDDLVTSPFLFAATSAPIVVVLDNGRQEVVIKLLEQLRVAPDIETMRQIRNKVIKQFATIEMKAVLNLITQAIEADKLERVHPFVMSKRDIIDYIPITNFSDSYESWEEANDQFLQSMKRTFFKEGDGKLRKAWLTKQGVPCTEAGIRRALKVGAANGDTAHKDFVDLEESLDRIIR